jgi:hypothetical protein
MHFKNRNLFLSRLSSEHLLRMSALLSLLIPDYAMTSTNAVFAERRSILAELLVDAVCFSSRYCKSKVVTGCFLSWALSSYANCFYHPAVHSLSPSSSSPRSCMALSSASFSCNSTRSTRHDLLSKGLGLTWISPLLAQRETLLGGKPSLCAATFIIMIHHILF